MMNYENTNVHNVILHLQDFISNLDHSFKVRYSTIEMKKKLGDIKTDYNGNIDEKDVGYVKLLFKNYLDKVDDRFLTNSTIALNILKDLIENPEKIKEINKENNDEKSE